MRKKGFTGYYYLPNVSTSIQSRRLWFKCLDHALHAKRFVTYKPKHDRAAADVVPHCVGRMDGDVDGCLQEKNLVGSWR